MEVLARGLPFVCSSCKAQILAVIVDSLQPDLVGVRVAIYHAIY